MRAPAEREGALRVEPAVAGALVEMWQQDDGLWRWLYRESSDRLVLQSNESYPYRQEALRSAGVAYPGVPVIERSPPTPDAPPSRRSVVSVAAALAAGAVLLALVVLAVTVLALGVVAAVAVARMRGGVLRRLRTRRGRGQG